MKKTEVKKLTLEEKISLLTGADNWQTESADGKVRQVFLSDGPSGLRMHDLKNNYATIKATALPTCHVLSYTWDTDLAFEYGATIADECIIHGADVLLGPGVNIKRSPLCGRNFEYLSEDPVVAGKMAAAEIRGIQSEKIAVSMKHFACNSKEVNRFGCDARISERALREIYLKGFEICVKESDPWTVMSSYNLINGLHTSESYELLTEILRNEWGFKGMVTTDWGQKNDPVKEVLAGNDMKMHIGYPEDLKKAMESGELSRADLELCVKRILEMFMKLV